MVLIPNSAKNKYLVSVVQPSWNQSVPPPKHKYSWFDRSIDIIFVFDLRFNNNKVPNICVLFNFYFFQNRAKYLRFVVVLKLVPFEVVMKQ